MQPLRWTVAVRRADLTAMPGFRYNKLAPVSQVILSGSVSEGQCVRIFTGAPMPEGADLVIVQENVSQEDAGTVSFIPHSRH